MSRGSFRREHESIVSIRIVSFLVLSFHEVQSLQEVVPNLFNNGYSMPNSGVTLLLISMEEVELIKG